VIFGFALELIVDDFVVQTLTANERQRDLSY
jgi:hypothetical protein